VYAKLCASKKTDPPGSVPLTDIELFCSDRAQAIVASCIGHAPANEKQLCPQAQTRLDRFRALDISDCPTVTVCGVERFVVDSMNDRSDSVALDAWPRGPTTPGFYVAFALNLCDIITCARPCLSSIYAAIALFTLRSCVTNVSMSIIFLNLRTLSCL
jgi:hypothetical protein